MSLFLELQIAIGLRLAEHAAFAGPPAVPISVLDHGEVRAQVEAAARRAAPLAAEIALPQVRAGERPREKAAAVAVRLFENGPLNRAASGTQAGVWALIDAALLQLERYVPRSPQLVSDIWTPLEFSELLDLGDEHRPHYALVFSTRTFTRAP